MYNKKNKDILQTVLTILITDLHLVGDALLPWNEWLLSSSADKNNFLPFLLLSGLNWTGKQLLIINYK